MRQAFRKYLERGIFAHGFARARFDDCRRLRLQGAGSEPLVQHTAHGGMETDAHFTDHVFPRQSSDKRPLDLPIVGLVSVGNRCIQVIAAIGSMVAMGLIWTPSKTCCFKDENPEKCNIQ